MALIKSYLYFGYDYFKSKYEVNNGVYNGIVDNYYYKNDTCYIEINGIEKLLVRYKGKVDFNVGDRVSFKGILEIPNENRTFHLFNYRKYLLSKSINYILYANDYDLVSKNESFIYRIKNMINNRLNEINNDYLYLFIMGNNKYLDDEQKTVYSNLGISHLFSISGMHIGIFSGVIIYFLSIFIPNKKITSLITCIFLLLYLLILGYSPSLFRSVLMFVIISFLGLINLKIKTYNVILFLFVVSIIYNPYILYNSGFLFTYIISFTLCVLNQNFNKFNYIKSLFYISLISSIISLPIVINNYFEVNIISPIINIFLVPLVSLVIFPMSLIVFIFPKLLFLFEIIINLFEIITVYISEFNLFMFTMKHLNLITIILYYIVFIFLIINYKNPFSIYSFLIIFIIFYSNINLFNNDGFYTMIDVGQGDCSLLALPNDKGYFLIDTGGYEGSTYAKNTIIPYLKSEGINRIDYLILSHGDQDHMGESINIINSFKVKNVIMNSSSDNDLEKDLLSQLKEKGIKNQKIIKKKLIINHSNINLISYPSTDENDNSIVLDTKVHNKHILLMGDASFNVENKLLEEYKFEKVDILKVGHHGSKTSSSSSFIHSIKPSLSLISVGKNIYGHPSTDVIQTLLDNKSKIYDTKTFGTIKINLNNFRIQTSL